MNTWCSKSVVRSENIYRHRRTGTA